MKVEGSGNLSLKVNGTASNPHLWGRFNFNNATASFNGLNMLLKNAQGSLEFNDKDTYLSTKQAFFDNKSVKIDGHCSLLGVQ